MLKIQNLAPLTIPIENRQSYCSRLGPYLVSELGSTLLSVGFSCSSSLISSAVKVTVIGKASIFGTFSALGGLIFNSAVTLITPYRFPTDGKKYCESVKDLVRNNLAENIISVTSLFLSSFISSFTDSSLEDLNDSTQENSMLSNDTIFEPTNSSIINEISKNDMEKILSSVGAGAATIFITAQLIRTVISIANKYLPPNLKSASSFSTANLHADLSVIPMAFTPAIVSNTMEEIINLPTAFTLEIFVTMVLVGVKYVIENKPKINYNSVASSPSATLSIHSAKVTPSSP